MYKAASREQILEKYNIAKERLRSCHIRHIDPALGPVCLVSSEYPGVWLEHAFDGLCYAESFGAPDVALNQMRLFLRAAKSDGRLPYKVLASGEAGYRQIQECVSFGSICYDVYEMTKDTGFLNEAYQTLMRWDEWQCRHRMTLGTGLIEMFCLYDTGHDNSARFEGIPNYTSDADGCVPAENDALPILAVDMNAVFYGDRTALGKMAAELGLDSEAKQWMRKAEEVKNAMTELLFDKEDGFFYDLDANGRRREIKSISITNVFTERMLSQNEFEMIWQKHMVSAQEFGTPYPLPSIAYNSGFKDRHAEKNCWGYYCQVLTALRCRRWMDFYGKSAEHDALLRKWADVYAQQDEKLFTQEIDPITGVPTDCSKWYSSAMLLYIYAVDRLHLI